MFSKQHEIELSLHKSCIAGSHLAEYPFVVCCFAPSLLPWRREYISTSFELWELYSALPRIAGVHIFAFHRKSDGSVELLASYDGGHDES